MSARHLVDAARRDGVILVPDGDTVRLRGEPEAVHRWAPRLRPVKAAVLAALADEEGDVVTAPPASSSPTFAAVESHLKHIALAARLPWHRMRSDPDGIRDVDIEDVREHWQEYSADPRFLRAYVAAVAYRLALDPAFIQ